MRPGPSPIDDYGSGNGVCGISVSFQYPFQFWLPFTSLNKQTNLDYGVGPRALGDLDDSRAACFACWLTDRIRSGWRDDHAAQLVEFAVSLPLLVLFVVGIFDFSNAFTLKQKLTNVARDAARAAAAEPASDLQSADSPMSVVDAFQDIDNYLLANNLSDCGVASTASVRA